MRQRQAGLSLIEMMIAVTISMLGALLMFQTMMIGEKAKRSSVSGNDGVRAGVIALDQLSSMARNAGSGLVQVPGSFNCLINAWSGNAQVLPRAGTPPAPFGAVPVNALRMMPLGVIDGGASPDVLIVMSGNSPSANVAYPRGEVSMGNTLMSTTNTVGLRNNDVLLMTRYSVDGTGTSSSANCFMTQVNATGAAVDGVTGYVTANPFSITGATMSAPNNALPGGRYTLSTLGDTPSLLAIGVRVSGGRSDLVSYDLLRDIGPTVIAENVLDFQVLYGVDTTVNAGRNLVQDIDYFGDGIVDLWVPPTGDWSLAGLTSVGTAGAPAWSGAERQRRIRSVRIGLITADTQTEKNAVDRLSNTLTLFESAGAGLKIDRSIGSGVFDNKMRFKVFEAMVPVRNLSSGLSPISDELTY